MHLLEATSTPDPAVTPIRPITPDIDFTWIYAGLGAVACLAVAGLFLYLLIQNLRGLGQAPVAVHVIGLVAALAAMFVLGTISTNTIWEPLRELAQNISGPGVIIILLAFSVFALANS
ncbi:hypothetical protein [Arthrobacter burdickii]|uniref:Uncharacterized protein n=1 Tax=Arthrobacter burdickii TaxID=3035920 RepID=A0ABT8K207_9MICC|nr:hypothetical protein [Arthrobacter burdickii]MDN4611468.1 hypothetical protein [Arthrobacter burdickii]